MNAIWKILRPPIRWTLMWLTTPMFLVPAYLSAILARLGNRPKNPRLVWGSTPLLNNYYWSLAMKKAGYSSETFVAEYYSTINRRDHWDRIVTEEYKWVPSPLKRYAAFIHSLFRYDVFFLSCDGYFIGRTPSAHLQAHILGIAGKKTVVIPYGSDIYTYKRIRSPTLLHGVQMSYPQFARDQERIGGNVDYWCANADAIIPGVMSLDGFGRWDVLMPSSLFIDLDTWKTSARNNAADGTSGVVTITHAPNHRGFKGTEFIIEAVRLLQAEGLKVELRLLEKIQNTEVRRILREDSDIHVDQIIATGFALNALEAMASGLPVVCNLEDDDYMTLMRRYSFSEECPLVSASPETLVDVLRKLIIRPELRRRLGQAGRAYVEKYHGLDSAEFLFTNIIEYVYGRRDSLINLYHPLLGEYPNRSPKVIPPLVKNRIVDL